MCTEQSLGNESFHYKPMWLPHREFPKNQLLKWSPSENEIYMLTFVSGRKNFRRKGAKNALRIYSVNTIVRKSAAMSDPRRMGRVNNQVHGFNLTLVCTFQCPGNKLFVQPVQPDHYTGYPRTTR